MQISSQKCTNLCKTNKTHWTPYNKTMWSNVPLPSNTIKKTGISRICPSLGLKTLHPVKNVSNDENILKKKKKKKNGVMGFWWCIELQSSMGVIPTARWVHPPVHTVTLEWVRELRWEQEEPADGEGWYRTQVEDVEQPCRSSPLLPTKVLD